MMALLLLASGLAAAADDSGKAVITQDISIKAKSAGPALPLPRPGPDKAVVDEVVGSLKIMSTDHSVRAASVEIPGSAKKLARPFPEAPYLTFSPRAVTAPYDLWTFEVLEGAETIYRQDGTGKVVETLEWDGTGASGEEAARVGKTYMFRFTGRRGPERFVLTSEPARLKSLAVREYLGGTRLEVSNEELFEKGQGKLSAGAGEYLRPMADRLRRLSLKDDYKLELRQADPDGALAQARAKALRKFFADSLLINAGRIQVERLGYGNRGDVTAALLPADKGDTIRVE